MLHYFARHFFSPTLISPYMDGGDVDVYIVMDELRVQETRRPVEYTLHFKPKSNPRSFNVFDHSTYDQHSDSQFNYRQTSQTTKTDFTGNLYIEMYSWDNMTPLHMWKVPFEVNLY